MNKNIATLLSVCRQLGIPYQQHHPTGNLVSVVTGPQRHLFVNWTTPLNPQSVMQLCQDKDYFHAFYSDTVRMPATESFLAPYCDEHYAGYRTRQTLFEIIEHAEAAFRYPVIVKKNRGSWGTNVFKVNNRRELERSLMDVFNVNSSAFDYVGLVQEYIRIGKEYRCVYVRGELVFCYEKVVANARYIGNLSPLHWEGAVARLERDETAIESLHAFCSPLFDKLPLPFCGLDVAIDVDGQYFLIEANPSPGFDHILRDGDDGMVAKTYRLMLEYLTGLANAP